MPSEWSSTVLDKAKAASKHNPSSKIHYPRDPFQGPYYGPENGPKVRMPNLDLTVAPGCATALARGQFWSGAAEEGHQTLHPTSSLPQMLFAQGLPTCSWQL